MDRPVVSMSGIDKAFSGTHVLESVDLSLYPGQVHALAGENGAGKSTLMRILAGILAPDAGTVEVDGVPLVVGPRSARDAGIAIVHQELMLAPNLSVMDNLLLGNEPRTRLGTPNTREARRITREVTERVGGSFSPTDWVGTLSIGQQQLVEIARALVHDPKVLVLDEPTTSLSIGEAQHLFSVIRELRGSGTAIVYISHRMEELSALADVVTVLRDGRVVETTTMAETDPDTIVSRMVGRPIETLFGRDSDVVRDDVELEVRGLAGHGVGPVDLEVRRGEVLGIGGLVGSGRSTVAKLIFGAVPRRQGVVRVGGSDVPASSPQAAMRAGIALVPEDRKSAGLVVQHTVADNMLLASLSSIARGGVVGPRAVASASAQGCADLGVKTTDAVRTPISSLSGGNQQKVLLAKWLRTDPRVLVLDEPTRGVDVGAKAEIYRIIEQCTAGGMAVIVVSSDLPELLGLSDRVLVMRRGEAVAQLDAEGLDEETVMRHAFGLAQNRVPSGEPGAAKENVR